MEANGLFSGMLGLEMPLHQNPQNPHHLMHQPQMVAYAPHHDPDNHQNPHQSVKQRHPFAPKSKQIALSDDDEPGFGADDNSNGDNKKKISPWQRMKWTDTMVRLLIMAVFYIGDEASDGPDPTGKKKPAGGLLQKKGKWKSVSRAMMEKGFYVSPQQCEDKFNDLNKRYKRVNDILGKGTACRVVENQGLLEKMDLAPKMKEEVRKLLNSKHLFFREMCAYHNSCGHETVGGRSNGAHNSPPEVATEPSEMPVWPQPHEQLQQQRCFHSSENAQAVANSGRSETKGSKVIKGGSGCEDEDEDFEDDDSDDEVVGGGSRGHIGHGNHEDNDDNDERAPQKVPRKEGCFSGSSSSTHLMQQLGCEVRVVLQDVSKTPWEKKQWLKTRIIKLQEQQVSYQHRAFELEKQRLKWIKYSGKKERYMERRKLENERRRLENERMLLVVRGKEFDLLELHHQQQQQNSSNKRSDPSSLTG
ncbi:hypothetical protein ACFX2B_009128 [Malus domestica]